MINEARLEKFRQVVETKFQIYNSLFMSLPYDKMTNIGMLLRFYTKKAEMVMKQENLQKRLWKSSLKSIQML